LRLCESQYQFQQKGGTATVYYVLCGLSAENKSKIRQAGYAERSTFIVMPACAASILARKAKRGDSDCLLCLLNILSGEVKKYKRQDSNFIFKLNGLQISVRAIFLYCSLI
jgi:hypothetical protein